MQFSNFAILALAAMLPISSACKCVYVQTPPKKDIEDIPLTQSCCDEKNGQFVDNDCVAHSISDNLKGFGKCCKKGHKLSDCPWPH
ncbi:hypothetical protein PT974_04470 [Cladobotryum mycophilum]|uniref:Uncharacterized protein n=1 Tax=Cladobotryum mycophilum TaxID=491253 RepID=A0ABR0SV87_9HYPO